MANINGIYIRNAIRFFLLRAVDGVFPSSTADRSSCFLTADRFNGFMLQTVTAGNSIEYSCLTSTVTLTL